VNYRDSSAKMHKSKVMRKLLGQPSATTNESVDTAINDSPQLRPSASQNTIYSAGAPIACLDQSPDGRRAVIAGSKVFKVLKVDGSTITEDIDLRAAITSYASTHDLSAATPEQLNIRAVKWSHGNLDTSIITACGNGRITVYDLNRIGEGMEVGRIHEHARQVHKLAINPHKPNWLLSASQDGTVKSFDIRMPSMARNGPIFSVWKTFKGNADAIRDVKWSPSDGMEFACSTDAGVVLKWDARKASAPLFKLTAHTSACFSIAWHPDGEHLISGGMDQHCHVWDMSKKAERNQKPRYSFTAPAPISTISWRPAFWSATAQGKRAAQVTVAYDDSNATRNQTSTVHLWDLARPTMPFKEIEQWDSSPTGILWNTRDLLWSVDKEGRFTQTDVAFIPQAVDRRSLSTFAFSPTGDVLMLLEERQAARRARPSLSSPEVSPSYQRDTSGPVFSVSRSDSEEDVVGSFLGPRPRKGHRRRHSGRSAQLSTTPPTAPGLTESKVMSLDDAVNITGLYKPQQVVAIGHAPSTARKALYNYYTNRYLLCMAEYKSDSVALPADVRTATIMEYYAKTSEKIGHFRLAQTWRLLAHTMNLLLKRRAEYHRQSRLTQENPISKDSQTRKQIKELKSRSDRGEETPRRWTRAQTPDDSPMQRPTRIPIREEVESTSNVATPLVRPVRDVIAQQTREAMHTPLIVEDDPLDLPEAAHSPSPSPIPVPGANQVSGHSGSSLEGYDFYGMESFSPAIAFVAPQRKQPLRLDYSEQNGPQRIQPHRHDSQESFQMFSTSGESQVTKFMSSSGSEGHDVGQDHDQDQGRALRERVSSWESSSLSNSGNRSSGGPDRSQSPAHMKQNSNELNRGGRNELSHRPASPPVFRLQEASAPSAVDHPPAVEPISQPTTNISASEKLPQGPNIIRGDFDPWPNDPNFTIPPIDPSVLVQRTINFEVQTGALNSAIMILLLRPLLPEEAIDDIQALAILRTYHHRLTGMKLFMEAGLLRNLCVPTYPTVFATGQENVTIGYFCTDCHKPIENDPLIAGSVWRCPRCHQAMNGCAVCKGREFEGDLDYETEDMGLELGVWFVCPGCGHGGHTICMQAWHSGPEYFEGEKYSGGCCPLEGCLHACLPGRWRQKRAEEKAAIKSKELEGLVRENSRGSVGRGTGRGLGVRRDAREVNQSKAVEGVRVALSGGVNVGGGVERKKSVKLVAPGEERRGN
jgi:WD repeat-containing protein 24